MKNILIQEVSTPGCSSCAKAKEVLEEIKTTFPNVKVEYIDMFSDKGQKLVTTHSIMSSPGIIVNGELFSSGGLDENSLQKKLKSLS